MSVLYGLYCSSLLTNRIKPPGHCMHPHDKTQDISNDENINLKYNINLRTIQGSVYLSRMVFKGILGGMFRTLRCLKSCPEMPAERPLEKLFQMSKVGLHNRKCTWPYAFELMAKI